MTFLPVFFMGVIQAILLRHYRLNPFFYIMANFLCKGSFSRRFGVFCIRTHFQTSGTRERNGSMMTIGKLQDLHGPTLHALQVKEINCAMRRG